MNNAYTHDYLPRLFSTEEGGAPQLTQMAYAGNFAGLLIASEAPGFTRCQNDLQTAPLTRYRHDLLQIDKCSHDAHMKQFLLTAPSFVDE